RLGRNTTAITRNPQSRLAKSCKDMIILDYADSHVLTSGSVGFLSSALTCISLVCNFRIKDAKKIFHTAKAHSKKIILRNTVYILGNQHTYPIAMYAAAKLGEVLGMDSHYERIEQFSHMGLFSAKKGDTVIIFANANPHTKRLVSHLTKLGLHVYNPGMSSNKIGLVLFYTFVSQFIPLNVARKKRIKDCYFVTQKKLRAASSDMIY
ncbi:MAG: SIS domain-containing protein, partial [Thaumarchaeota archaeon]|nr:SIS domain-containing protein [Nitrososphaerota archaeon]